MSNFFPPSVDIVKKQIEMTTSMLLSEMISVVDLDSNPITRYRFRDDGFLNYSGYFTVNGVRQAAGVWIEVTAAQLSTVRYHAALIESAETIGVQVYDGAYWSVVDYDSIVTRPFNGYRPVVTAINGSVLANENRRISDGTFTSTGVVNLFRVTDQDGDQPVRFFIVDRATHALSGFFRLDGVAKPQGQFFLVEAADISRLRYVAGSWGPTSEQIGVMAYDGKYWSDVVNFTINTTPNNSAPVLTPRNIASPLGAVVPASDLFTFTDADGNTIKRVWFLDTGTNPNSGYFSVNGVRQAAGSFFSVAYNDLATVRYHFSGLPETEILRMQVWDGRFTSAIQTATAQAVPKPTIAVPDFSVVLDTAELVNWATLFTKSDSGPAHIRYEVVDLDGDPTSARIVNHNGVRLLGNQIYSFTAAEFANVRIEGSLADTKRGFERMMVRAFNGTDWTDWTSFDVATEHVGNRALTSGARWGNSAVSPTVVTYAFIDGNFDPNATPPRWPRVPLYYPEDADEHDNAQVLHPVQRAMVREVLAMYETFANIDFVERAYDPTGDDIMTMFGVNNQQGSQGYAYLPFGDGRRSRVGDIWFHGGSDQDPEDGGVTDPQSANVVGNSAPGSFGRLTAIHEIGHSIGFRHPFDPPIGLPVSTDTVQFTVMSYTDGVGTTSLPSTLMLYDIMELQRLYGVNTTYRTGNDQYFFNTTNTTLQAFWDAGGIDTLNYTQMPQRVTADLRQGRYQLINGLAHLLLPYGMDIENVRGGSNNDSLTGNNLQNFIFGNAGNDVITGNGGNDYLRGGAGNDTYVWRPSDGHDEIDEEGLAGRDVIQIRDVAGNLNSLQDDFSFRRLGDDLRIDFSFNLGESLGSITVKRQSWGGYRVETMQLFDLAGNQIGGNVDLTSIMAQATAIPTRFRLTDFQTTFGFIAQPV